MRFDIGAKTELPDHLTKGTASENRRDIKKRVKQLASSWRQKKLEELKALREHVNGAMAVPLAVKPQFWSRQKVCKAWWIGGAVLLEPHQFGRNCREGWIEVLQVGKSTHEVAELIAQIYADGDDDELACKAALHGLCRADIYRILVAGREEGWHEAKTLMNELSQMRGGTQ